MVDLKRCARCLVHGEMLSHTPRQCARSKCSCRKCELVNRRRVIKSQLDKLRRRQKVNRTFEGRTTDTERAEGHLFQSVHDSPYTCLRCRHHGVVASKRFHSPCPYSMCRCKSCDLIEERTQIEKELTQIQRREKNPNAAESESKSSASESLHSFQKTKDAPEQAAVEVSFSPEAMEDSRFEVDSHTDDTATIGSSPYVYENDKIETLSPEAKIILELITAISEDPKSVNPDNFDVDALFILLSLPTFHLPRSWLNEWPNINYLLGESLKRILNF